jgi:hypothetical protein
MSERLDDDKAKSQHVMQAMFKIKKLDVKALKRAYASIARPAGE